MSDQRIENNHDMVKKMKEKKLEGRYVKKKIEGEAANHQKWSCSKKLS